MNDALVLNPETDRFAVSMIPMKIGIYLALLDKRHVVAVVDVVAHSIHGPNHYLTTHSHQNFHNLRFVANRMSAIHGYTSIHLYSSLIMLRQIRTHNTANNRADVDNNRTLRDIQRCLMMLTLLDSHPTIVLLLTVA